MERRWLLLLVTIRKISAYEAEDCTPYMIEHDLAGKFVSERLRILQPEFTCEEQGQGIYGMGNCFGSFEQHVSRFANCTGVDFDWTPIPVADLEREVNSDLGNEVSSGEGFYDIYIVRTRMVVGPANDSLLHDMANEVDELNGASYLDMFATVREWDTTFASDELVYFMPLDSDVNALALAYPDLIDEEDAQVMPNTWEEVLELAKKYDKAFNVTTSSGEEVPVRGFCCYCGSGGPALSLFTVLAPILQSRGTNQGLFFDPDDFEPYFKTEAFQYGAKLWKDLAEFTKDRDGCSEYDDFNECLFSMSSPTKSVQRGGDRVRFAPPPGSTMVMDPTNGEMRRCRSTDSDDCPYADRHIYDIGDKCFNNSPTVVDLMNDDTPSPSSAQDDDADMNLPPLVNRAPFYLSPWAATIRQRRLAVETRSRDAAAHLLVSASVEMDWGGFSDVWRKSQTEEIDYFEDSASKRELICTYDICGDHENRALDLRIVGATSEYYGNYDSVTGQALDNLNLLAAQYLHSQSNSSLDDFVDAADQLWTDRNKCGGKTTNCQPLDKLKQHQAYRRSLNLDVLTEFQQCQMYREDLKAVNGPQQCDAFFDDVKKVHLSWSLFLLGLILCGIVVATAFFAAIWTYIYRHARVVRNAQPTFLYLIALGCALSAMTIIPLGIDDKRLNSRAADVACRAAPWFYCSGFVIAFGAIAAKIERVRRLFAQAERFQKGAVTVMDTLTPIICLLLVEIGLLLSWSIVDPLAFRRTVSNADNQSRGHCVSQNLKHHGWEFFAPILALQFFVLLCASVLAYFVRKRDAEYAESHVLFITVYVHLHLAALALPVLFLVARYPRVDYVLRVVILFLSNESTLLLLFVPKVRMYYKNYRKARSQVSSTFTSSHYISSSTSSSSSQQQQRGDPAPACTAPQPLQQQQQEGVNNSFGGSSTGRGTASTADFQATTRHHSLASPHPSLAEEAVSGALARPSETSEKGGRGSSLSLMSLRSSKSSKKCDAATVAPGDSLNNIADAARAARIVAADLDHIDEDDPDVDVHVTAEANHVLKEGTDMIFAPSDGSSDHELIAAVTHLSGLLAKRKERKSGEESQRESSLDDQNLRPWEDDLESHHQLPSVEDGGLEESKNPDHLPAKKGITTRPDSHHTPHDSSRFCVHM